MADDRIYDPNHRAHLSLGAVQTRLNNLPSRITSFAPPASITEVLTRLSNKEVTGHDAKDLVIQFLAGHGILDQDNYKLKEGKEAEFELFGRLLDRNLIAGFGARTLSMVDWKTDTRKPEESATVDTKSSNPPSTTKPVNHPTPTFTQAQDLPTPRRNLKSFPVALGKSIEPPFTEIAKSSCKWYASRKLDGVRVIAFIDILIYDDGFSARVHDINFFSRTGKAFTSLGKVRDQFVRLVACCPVVWGLLESHDGNIVGLNEEGSIKRLVFDGEVCVMREKTGLGVSEKKLDEGTGAGAIWSDDSLEEDFTSTVSEIRRMAPYEISHPVYYIFDVLPYDLFAAGKGPSKFSERVRDIRDLGDWLAAPENEQKILRPLAQWEIKDPSEIDGMVARAADEGWEGLVLRADKPYKGSRSYVQHQDMADEKERYSKIQEMAGCRVYCYRR
jgi:DNA ligase-1